MTVTHISGAPYDEADWKDIICLPQGYQEQYYAPSRGLIFAAASWRHRKDGETEWTPGQLPLDVRLNYGR